MSEAEKMADYLGFEVVYLDGFAYIKEQGEQGPEIKREATLEERTLWTELGAVSEELEALKRAIGDAEPQYQIHRGELCYKSTEDDQSFNMWCPAQDVPEGTRFYTLKGIK